jgi:hypothetical protein
MSAIAAAMTAISNRVKQIAAGEEVERAIHNNNLAAGNRVLDEVSGNEAFENSATMLNRILQENGEIPSDLSAEFKLETGFSPEELAQSSGSTQAIRNLLQERYADRIHEPDFMRAKGQQILRAVRNLSADERLKESEQAARMSRATKAIEADENASRHVEVRNGRIELKMETMQKVLAASSLLSITPPDCSGESSAIQSQLEQSRQAVENLNTAKTGLQNLQSAFDSLNTSSGSVLPELGGALRNAGERLQAIENDIETQSHNLSSYQSQYESARQELFTLLGIQKEPEDPAELAGKIQAWLIEKAFADNFSDECKKVFALLEKQTALAEEITHTNKILQEKSAELGAVQADIVRISNQAVSSMELAETEKTRLLALQKEMFLQSHLNSSEKDWIQRNAQMKAVVDENLANGFANRYLSGFIKKGENNANYIENIRFHSFTDESISFDIVLAETSGEFNDQGDFTETKTLKTVSLTVAPRMVKNQPNTCDFLILNYSEQKTGEEKTVLTAELNALLPPVIELLNSSPFHQKLHFSFFSTVPALRVVNALPVFDSFPNFQVAHLKLDNNRMELYGAVSGQELGAFIAGFANPGQTNEAVPLRTPAIHGENAAIAETTENSGVNSDLYHRKVTDKNRPAGDVSIRIAHFLLNDFYKSFRTTILDKARKEHWPRMGTDPKSRLHDLMNGLNEFNIYFGDNSKITLQAKGNMQLLGKEVSDVYFKTVKYIAALMGAQQGLAESRSFLIKIATLGFVEVEVDPNDYRPPSGQFVVMLEGRSAFRNSGPENSVLNLSFTDLSLYDPVAPGALQYCLHLAENVTKVANFFQDLGNGIIGAVNVIPGVNIRTTSRRIDDLLLTYGMGQLASQLNANIHDLQVKPRTYKDIDVSFKAFSLIDGLKTSLQQISISRNNLEIKARFHP